MFDVIKESSYIWKPATVNFPQAELGSIPVNTQYQGKKPALKN